MYHYLSSHFTGKKSYVDKKQATMCRLASAKGPKVMHIQQDFLPLNTMHRNVS